MPLKYMWHINYAYATGIRATYSMSTRMPPEYMRHTALLRVCPRHTCGIRSLGDMANMAYACHTFCSHAYDSHTSGIRYYSSRGALSSRDNNLSDHSYIYLLKPSDSTGKENVKLPRGRPRKESLVTHCDSCPLKKNSTMRNCVVVSSNRRFV